MTEQELVNAVITKLRETSKDVSTTPIIVETNGGEQLVCYDSSGNISRISPTTLSSANKKYMTESQYKELVSKGEVEDNVEYNIYENE